MAVLEETYVPHVGWLRHEAGDDVATYLRQGWFEYIEQALMWLYLRPGDTVVDCGAHVGLFSLLAAQAMENQAVVIGIEPNPLTASLLQTNIDQNAATCVRAVRAAAASTPGTLCLHAGHGASSAYSSVVIPIDHSSDTQVKAITLDDLFQELKLSRVDLLKIDVEGAELDVWKGCAANIAADRLPLVMVEFTESNQQAIGLTSTDLAQGWLAFGYTFHRLNLQSLQLEPVQVEKPIEYENLFAARDIAPINKRLATAPAHQRRVAQEILNRGKDAFALLKRACDAEQRCGEIDRLSGVVAALENQKADLDARVRAMEQRAIAGESHAAELQEVVQQRSQYLQQLMQTKSMRIASALRLVDRPDWMNDSNHSQTPSADASKID